MNLATSCINETEVEGKRMGGILYSRSAVLSSQDGCKVQG